VFVAAFAFPCAKLDAAPDATDPAFVECHPRAGLPNFFAKLEAGGPVRIAYLGGSITEAAGWRVYSREWFARTYPRAQVSEIRATISGTGAEFVATRLGNHVLRHLPDLVFIEFAVNGAGATPVRSLRSVEGIVRQIRIDNPTTEICFVFTLSSGMLPARRAGRLPAVIAGMQQVAEHYGVATIDFAPEVVRRESEGTLVFTGKLPPKDTPLPADAPMVFSTDGTHPLTWTGHRLYLDVLVRSVPALQAAGRPGPHPLPAALDPLSWETVELVAIDSPGISLSSGWQSIAPPGDTEKNQRISQYLPGVWQTTRPGDTLEFTFNGTAFGFSGFRNPSAGRFSVTINDQPPIISTLLDSYGYAGRISHRAWFHPVDLPPGLHRVKITFLEGPPDRTAFNKTSAPAAPPPADAELVLQLGALLLAGKLVP
jgi:hypothetical protein